MFLTEQEIRQIIKIKKKSGSTLYGTCPKCGKDEFGISVIEPNLFGCFRKKMCGFAGNSKTLLKFLALPLKKQNLKYSGIKLESKELVEKINIEEQTTILPHITMPIGFRRVYEHDYLRHRGYTDIDFQYYNCGSTKLDPKLSNRIIIGFPDFTGKIIAYTGRTLCGDEPKYRNSSGKVFSKILDGLTESKHKEVTIVEGHFDRINVRNKYLNLGIENRVVCSFGAKFSDEQISLLQHQGIEHVNLFFDPDILPIIIKNTSKISHKFKTVNVMLLNDLDKDPGDSNEIEIGEAYLNKQNFIKFTTNTLPKNLKL